VSFDTLLTVLFVVVFIVLPLVSRVLRERNRPPTSGQGPARPPAPGGSPAEQAPPSGQGDLPEWVAEAQRRVREARERATAEASTLPEQSRTLVSEDPFQPLAPADRQRTMVPEDPFRGRPRVPTRGRSLVPEDPFEKGLVGPEDARRAGTGLGREGMAPAAGPRARRETAGEAELRTATAAGEAPSGARRRQRRPPAAVDEVWRPGGMPAHARRHAGRDGARLLGVGQLRFDRDAIVSGLIWHEILDEPAWKRLRGRVPSRRRSR
jgi:hypothetical protein